MQGRGFRTVVSHGNAPQEVFWGAFSDFLKDVEIAAFIKHSHVREFPLWAESPQKLVLQAQFCVGILSLRILIQRLGVGMGRRGIQIIITLFDVFAVVAFVPVEPEKTFLEDGITSIPKRWCKAHSTLPICPALQAVLAPAIRPAARVIMRKGVPTIAVIRVVLAHGAPLTFA